jgi:hypothetical protein
MTGVAGIVGWFLLVVLALGSLGIAGFFTWLVVGGTVGLAQGSTLWWYVHGSSSMDPDALVRPDWLWFRKTQAGETDYRVLYLAGWAFSCVLGFLLGLIAFFTCLILGSGLLTLLSSQVKSFGLFAVVGLVYGLVQCMLLRVRFGGALMWIAVSALGWGLGGFVGDVLGHLVADVVFPAMDYDGIIAGPKNYVLAFVQGSIGATIYGLVSSIGVTRIINLASQEKHPALLSSPEHF